MTEAIGRYGNRSGNICFNLIILTWQGKGPILDRVIIRYKNNNRPAYVNHAMKPLENMLHSPKKHYAGFSVLIAVIALAVLISSAVFTLRALIAPGENTQPETNDTHSFDLKETRDGWWETSDEIYFGIPARIVFRMPENAEEPTSPETIAREIWTEFDRIGNIFNAFDPDSETGRLNSSARQGMTSVSSDMMEVLLVSQKLWETSGGAFDPTMLPVKRMWEDAVRDQKVPSNRDILKTMSSVGFENVAIYEDSGKIRIKKRDIRFDFGGVAKGYAVDQVAGVLEAHGIPAALIALAGEIRTFGDNNGRPWRIGIQHPLDMGEVWGAVSAETDIRVSTSGNYRQPLRIAGREFYHIFDPDTGRPVSEKILGVTTLCASGKASGAFLDGAATAIVVLGAKKGMVFAEKTGIEALIIRKSGSGEIEELMTDGFRVMYEPFR